LAEWTAGPVLTAVSLPARRKQGPVFVEFKSSLRRHSADNYTLSIAPTDTAAGVTPAAECGILPAGQGLWSMVYGRAGGGQDIGGSLIPPTDHRLQTERLSESDVSMPASTRHSMGVPGLDSLLGGGLLPGTLTVVAGATGIGKTQLGVHYAAAGSAQEGRRGVFFDLSARGDSQSHAEYAQRIFDWQLAVAPADSTAPGGDFFQQAGRQGDYLHVFDYGGRRVTKQDLDFDEWRNWQAELNLKLRSAIGFLYGNFASQARRVVVDGVEPTDRPHDSIQFNLFEYIYHQVLRKDPEWVARDLFRERYRQHAEEAQQHRYDPAVISCLLLYTSRETMLDDLISRPLDEGDVLSNANTLIYLGKVRSGTRVTRGLYVAKHRGSECSDSIVPYEIGEDGISLEV
jgi:KaiC/GvpD/RAD55 family RecA-like ATPase